VLSTSLNSAEPATDKSTQLLPAEEFRAELLSTLRISHNNQTESKLDVLPMTLRAVLECEISNKNVYIVAELLQVQDESGWNFGMLVARYQTVAATQQYLQLLSNIIKQNVRKPNEIIKFLNLQRKDGWNFGMLVARYQIVAATQQYLQLLSDLIKQNVCEPNEIIKFLNLQSVDGITFGMFVARYQTVAATQQYLQLLSDIIKQNVYKPNENIKFLNLQSVDGMTFGMFVARFQTVAATQQYLQLLSDLIKQNVCEPNEIIKLLNLQQDGWTFGMLVARHQTVAATQQYLQLLSDLIKHNVESNEIIKLLNWQSANGGLTFGMLVASNQGSLAIVRYLFLLLDLMQDGKFVQEIYGSICLLDDGKHNMLAKIPDDDFEENKAFYIDVFLYFISKLITHGITARKIDNIFNFRTKVNGYIAFGNNPKGNRVARLIDEHQNKAQEITSQLVIYTKEVASFVSSIVKNPETDPELDAAAPYYMPNTYSKGKIKLA
jgi:hypothetical protein